jgi:hypothetical protein
MSTVPNTNIDTTFRHTMSSDISHSAQVTACTGSVSDNGGGDGSSDSSSNDGDGDMDESLTIWTVLITEFTDDYKCRYGDWASHRGPYLFSSLEKAESFTCTQMLQFLVDHEYTYDSEYNATRRAYVPHIWQQNKHGDFSVKSQYTRDYATLSKAIRPFIQGEFVDVKMRWDIQPGDVDDYEVSSPCTDSDTGTGSDTDSDTGSDTQCDYAAQEDHHDPLEKAMAHLPESSSSPESFKASESTSSHTDVDPREVQQLWKDQQRPLHSLKRYLSTPPSLSQVACMDTLHNRNPKRSKTE